MELFSFRTHDCVMSHVWMRHLCRERRRQSPSLENESSSFERDSNCNLSGSLSYKRETKKLPWSPKAALQGQLISSTSGRTWLPGTALLIPILEGATLPAHQWRELSAANKSSFGKEPYFPWMRHVSRMNASLCVARDDRQGNGLSKSERALYLERKARGRQRGCPIRCSALHV